MSGAALEKASVATDPNAERLAAFREKEGAARGFADQTDPVPPAEIQSRTAPAGHEKDDEPAMPRLRVDPRDAIAARLKASRAAANPDAHTSPVDRFNVPHGVPVEGDEDEDARLAEERASAEAETQRSAAPQRATPPAAPQSDGRYSLRVNGNNFMATRDELIRYAEVEPDEAAGMSDASLVRLAQKQMAASSFLDEARAAAKSARTVQRSPQADTPGQDEPNADTTVQGAENGLHSLSDRQLIEKVQFGDADEALEAQTILTRRQMSAFSAADRMRAIDGEIGTAIERFGAESQDIASDPFMQAVHRTALVDEVVDELARKAQGVTQQHIAHLKANPNLAMQAYKAGRMDGLQLRTPDELFTAAAQTVRSRFSKEPPPAKHENTRETPPAARSDRTEAKRGLIAQPRPESTSVSAQTQPARRASASETIRSAFGNRMNRG